MQKQANQAKEREKDRIAVERTVLQNTFMQPKVTEMSIQRLSNIYVKIKIK